MGMNIEIPDGELFRGQAATLLVEMATRYIQPRRRIIAIGRCQSGSAFTVTTQPQAPADFADAIDEVLRPDRVPTARNMADTDTSLASEALRLAAARVAELEAAQADGRTYSEGCTP